VNRGEIAARTSPVGTMSACGFGSIVICRLILDA